LFYAILILSIAALAAMAVQQYALRKRSRGFSLRDGEPPRRRLFADPDEEAMRQWLEADDDDDAIPQPPRADP
jgi:hypothetical protein